MYAPHFTPDLYATFTNNSAPLAGRMIVSPVGKLAIPPFPTYPLSTQTNTLLLSVLLLRFFVIKRDIMMFRFRPEIERILSGISRGGIDGGIWKWVAKQISKGSFKFGGGEERKIRVKMAQ